jgi:aminomethyltransferase
LWDALFDKGEIHGIRPMGTHALEIARIEAGFLQAHVDFMPADQAIHPDRARSPFELDLGRLVDFKKPNFNGRRALLEEQKNGSRYRFVKLDVAGNKVAKAAYIYNRKSKGDIVGTVTSAGWSPSAKTNIAFASLHMPWGRPGDELWAGHLLPARAAVVARHGSLPGGRRRVLRPAAASRYPGRRLLITRSGMKPGPMRIR